MQRQNQGDAVEEGPASLLLALKMEEGSQAKEYGQSLETGKARKHSPQERNPDDTSILVQ